MSPGTKLQIEESREQRARDGINEEALVFHLKG
jgi:hypothetical protein